MAIEDHELDETFDIFFMDSRHLPTTDWVDPRGSRRTKVECPYSYDPFYIWRDNTEGAEAVYHDRMQQWDHEKYKAAFDKTGGRLNQWTRKEASKFLSAYFDKPVRAVGLAEGCNQSNGYPYWIFWYVEKKATK